MAITALEVVNRALVRLRIPTLKSLVDTGPVGDAVRTSFPGIRQALLRRHPWRFAMERAKLGAVEPKPLFGWKYRHPLPKSVGVPGTANHGGGWLRFNGVWAEPDESRPQIPHSVEGAFVLTNETPIYVKYVGDQPKLFTDSLFAEALTYALAEELALSLKQSTELSEQMRRNFNEIMLSARAANAFDASPPPVVASFEPSPLSAYYEA